MKKIMLVLVIGAAIISLVFFGMLTREPTQESDVHEEELLNMSVEDKALAIVQALQQKDMKIVSEYVHPEKGLLFSPYAYIEEKAIIFHKEQVASLLTDNHQYVWGHYDGTGLPIELTPTQYLEDILFAHPYHQADEILVDKIKQRGNTIISIKEIFPQSRVVDFYLPGSKKYEGMDWASLLLVFEQDGNGEWMLAALVNDKWTI